MSHRNCRRPIIRLVIPLCVLVSCMLTVRTAHAALPKGACQKRGEGTQKGNGTELFGTKPELTAFLLKGASKDGQPITLRVDGERIIARTGDRPETEDLSGVTLYGLDRRGNTKLVILCPSDNGSKPPWYRLQLSEKENEWQDACSIFREDAVTVSGVWDEKGDHHSATDRFTVSCGQSGAIGKCSMDYDPRRLQKGATLQWMQDARQACTRMMRADYCGDGKSQTQHGQRIDYEDSRKIASFDNTKNPVEASWDASGAVCVSHFRLSKTTAVSLQGECPNRFEQKTLQLQKDCELGPGLLRNRSLDPGPTLNAPRSLRTATRPH